MSARVREFVAHFGEMGSRWGLNRTLGQVYALLMVSDEALNAEQIMAALKISRGNVSMALKELQAWQLVTLQHMPGQRKEYFQVSGQIWDMGLRILEERRKREIEPTLQLLKQLVEHEPDASAEAHAQAKMREMHDLLELVSRWSRELQDMQPETLRTLMQLGGGVAKVLEAKSKILGKK